MLVAHVGSGTYEPLQLLPLVVVGVAYAMRARTLARRGKPVSTRRQVSFAAGVALIIAALVSPLAHLGEELLVAHMAQHLVLGDLASLLIVLGLTGPLLQPLLSVRGLGWLRGLVHPLVALPIWIANLILWHVPALYQGALSSEPLHALEHASFFGAGLVMWMALLGPLPKPAWFGNLGRLLYVVVVRFAGAALGNAFMWAGTVFYPDYAPGEASWDIAPLADQGAAGVVMTLEQGMVTLGLFTWLFFRWANESEERQRLLDLAEARGIPLDEARAARAVAAGQGARLEQRLRESEPPRHGGGGAEHVAGLTEEQPTGAARDP
jgi:cytochrome c oxidase assembly factor CtaG